MSVLIVLIHVESQNVRLEFGGGESGHVRHPRGRVSFLWRLKLNYFSSLMLLCSSIYKRLVLPTSRRNAVCLFPCPSKTQCSHAMPCRRIEHITSCSTGPSRNSKKTKTAAGIESAQSSQYARTCSAFASLQHSAMFAALSAVTKVPDAFTHHQWPTSSSGDASCKRQYCRPTASRSCSRRP